MRQAGDELGMPETSAHIGRDWAWLEMPVWTRSCCDEAAVIEVLPRLWWARRASYCDHIVVNELLGRAASLTSDVPVNKLLQPRISL
mmetsp:Transcript_12060/g.27961  ORF Transcript_12060/g.27961 Transcript_12060/m.27961 type:complete len:87 (+) Transcript_12060:917-1177(+)